jgi:hypothetical protein
MQSTGKRGYNMNTFRPDLITSIEDLSFCEWRDFLIYDLNINEDVIDCLCSVNGYEIETLNDVCNWKFGMTCEQMLEEMKGEC